MKGARLGLLLALLAPADALGSPIRANTPGTGVFQGSGILGGFVADRQSGGGAEASSLTSIAELRYTPSTHWVFGVRVPVHVESHVESPGLGSQSASGPGDVVLTGKHRFFRQVGRWQDRHAAVELGVKLPTGSTDRPADPRLAPALHHRLQPGTGSTDFLASLVYQQARGKWGQAADVSYRLNGEGDGDYRQGDEVRLNGSLQYILFPRVYTRPGRELFVLLEGTATWKEADRLRDTALPGTRRTELLLAPGLQYVATERLFLELSVQFPLSSDVDEEGLASDWNALANFRFAF
ncbi:MAG TPA: transporter [Thermoanaerobaculia bacterium]|nr:transporter [Thermoanaerobaculia bacterium]